MDDDYVNKQIVCPTCGGKDIIYIDLNDIRDDPNASSGAVTRAFSHKDHLLLLDIDHQGDIRTVNKISRQQKIEINQERYTKIIEFIHNYDAILMISDDIHLELIFEEEVNHLDVDIEFVLEINPIFNRFTSGKKDLFWLKNDDTDKIPVEKWKVVYYDNTSSIDPKNIAEQLKHVKIAIVDTEETKNKLSDVTSIDQIYIQ